MKKFVSKYNLALTAALGALVVASVIYEKSYAPQDSQAIASTKDNQIFCNFQYSRRGSRASQRAQMQIHDKARIPASDNNTPCTRSMPGSVVPEPENIFSSNGELNVNMAFRGYTDSSGLVRYCFVDGSGNQAPTLHVRAKDKLNLTVSNESQVAAPEQTVSMQFLSGAPLCASGSADKFSTNVHFHGMNVRPACTQDDVLWTYISAQKTFSYRVPIPANISPGLYFYHPHVHGIAESQMLGGAPGALVVDGLENFKPEIAGLDSRTFVIRDNLVPGNPTPSATVPSWDLSINYVPVPYPNYIPAQIFMKPGEKQLWRVVNATADSILDVQLQYDQVPQDLQIVSLDAVPVTGSVNKKSVLLGPAARVEFIAEAPAASVKSANLSTLFVDTGPDGDSDLTRTLAKISTTSDAKKLPTKLWKMPKPDGKSATDRFEHLSSEKATTQRKIYFSEVSTNPDSEPTFFITVDGATPRAFDMNQGPSIVTKQGSVEDWVIENRAQESHVFHIHQTHFMLLEKDGVAVPKVDQQIYDTMVIPYWDGKSSNYPSVKLRMDFRAQDVGDFVYHCHLMGHEDNGMMAIIRVLPK